MFPQKKFEFFPSLVDMKRGRFLRARAMDGDWRDDCIHGGVAMFRVMTVFGLMLVSAGLWAQAVPSSVSETNARAVGLRYTNESDAWRLSLIRFIMKGETAKYGEVEAAMKQFTAVTTSYIVYKRPGHEMAQELYYRNLENITRIEQLKQLVEMSHRDNPEYTKDFFGKYSLADTDFADFDAFEKVYERIMGRWRGEFEAAMQKKAANELKVLREDMKMLQQVVSAFVLLPGRSSNKVPQLQNMENELRHGIVMLRMYAETMQQTATPAGGR